MLCKANTIEDVWWAVCTVAKEGICDTADEIKKEQPKMGNSAYHRHVILHNKSGYHKDKRLKVTIDRKNIIIESAGKEAIMNRYPLKFCEHKKGFNS